MFNLESDEMTALLPNDSLTHIFYVTFLNKTKVESDRLGRLLESSLFVAQNLVFSPLLIVVVPPWFLA